MEDPRESGSGTKRRLDESGGGGTGSGGPEQSQMVKNVLAEFMPGFKLEMMSSIGVSLGSSFTKMVGQMVVFFGKV